MEPFLWSQPKANFERGMLSSQQAGNLGLVVCNRELVYLHTRLGQWCIEVLCLSDAPSANAIIIMDNAQLPPVAQQDSAWSPAHFLGSAQAMPRIFLRTS